MWRIAIYSREASGRGSRARLDQRLQRLAAQVRRRSDWQGAMGSTCRPLGPRVTCRAMTTAAATKATSVPVHSAVHA